MTRSYIHHAATVNSLGNDRDTCLHHLEQQRIAPTRLTVAHLNEPRSFPYFRLSDPAAIAAQSESRLLAWLRLLLNDTFAAYPLSDTERQRTGLFLASSSVGIESAEAIYRQQLQRDPGTAIPVPQAAYHEIGETLALEFGLSPCAYTVMTACTSAANALLFAHTMLQAGRLDHALVIGAEMFNEISTLGFLGLELISATGEILPFDKRRNGLVLGEGIGLMLLSREPAAHLVALCGGASNTDCFSPTSANPDGSSIAHVIRATLHNSGTTPAQVRAVKVHGTASQGNDESEARGLLQVFPDGITAYALKPFIGHTLGACAAIETVLSLHALQAGFIPATTGIGNGSDAFALTLNQIPMPAASGRYLLNYFAFGGNNTALVLEKP